ncbi:MAG: hypothetical protein LBD73_04360 [Deferribacteraceae bacterium]|jgi:hypothetical protein|nr:hypothetical protein [Deferribacteraceae bacterium]
MTRKQARVGQRKEDAVIKAIGAGSANGLKDNSASAKIRLVRTKGYIGQYYRFCLQNSL